MAFTFGEVKKMVAPYAGRAGKCADDADTAMFARRVMELLLYEGSDSAIRKYSTVAYKRCLVLPPEIDLPIKARIDNRSAEVWSKWGTFSSADPSFEKCPPVGDILIEDGAQTPLVYPVPAGGSILGVMGTCTEKDDAYVILQGNDPQGRPIYTVDSEGKQITGEKFKLVPNQIRYGRMTFGEVTGVLKTQTSGYVKLFAVEPAIDKMLFLAEWGPLETRPMYRKFQLVSERHQGPVALSMLCRVKLKDSYHDNEFTLFDNSIALMLAAQRLQSEVNNEADIAAYKAQAMRDVLDKQAGNNKISGRPVDVFYPLSGGSIKNIVGRYR